MLDPIHGWTLGTGNTSSQQGRMALEFYQAVAGSGNWLSANISLTGHSLGGGLAGYVGAIYDQDAVLFDSMSFESAAVNTSNYTVTLWDGTTNYQYVGIKPSEVSTYTAPSGWTVTSIQANASADLRNIAYGGAAPWDHDLNGISGTHLDWEILGLVRWDQETQNPGLDLGDGVFLVNSVQRHDMAALAIRMFADVGGSSRVQTH